MTLQQVKKLDEYTLKRVKDGEGPCDMCICHILSMPEDRTLVDNIKLGFNNALNKVREVRDNFKAAGSLQEAMKSLLPLCKIGGLNKKTPDETTGAKGKKRKDINKVTSKSSRSSNKQSKVSKKSSNMSARSSKSSISSRKSSKSSISSRKSSKSSLNKGKGRRCSK